MMPPLELCNFTLWPRATLSELIDVAATCGFDSISTAPSLVEAAESDLGTLRQQCTDRGVTVGYIDGLMSALPGLTDGVSEERCFEIAEALGAPTVNAVHYGGSPVPLSEMSDALGGLTERAAQRGLRIVIEFIPGTGIPDLPTALELVRDVGDDNLRVLLDTWHLARSGGGPELLTDEAAALIGALQISDRRRAQDSEPYVPMTGRHLPGDGDLPLVEILAPVVAAHPDLPVGVEVLSEELRAMSTLDAARAAERSLRELLTRVG
jgi:sugar phosphate isomerase/epimerase